MANLRDKGYPSAKEYRPNRSEKNNLVWTSDMGIASPTRLPLTEDKTPAPNTTRRERLDSLMTAYNRRAFASPTAPLFSRYNNEYVTNDTDERAYEQGIVARNRNMDRYGYADRTITPTSTSYSVGIDNLPFGTNEYSKSFNTPLGVLTADYDGDTTASLNFKSSPYYLQALANLLLNRGTL